ncbi:MAG: hypothetical protein PHN47_07850 [Clostridia bacterium]|jgi:hypothetical protein|nr:hypothetical protein [Clostridia bacterium]MDD4572375.1 hypothetical protein [Clostridia bacterium]
MISEVKANQPLKLIQNIKAKQQIQSAKGAEVQNGKTDSIEISKAGSDATPVSKSTVYENVKNGKVDHSYMEKIKAETEQANQNLRSLVEKLLLKQGKISGVKAAESETFALADADSVAKAREAISEDGEFGVKAVSERIFNFAVALSGGDTSKLEELKASIDKGFAEAEKAFGGALPNICNQTYDAIMTKLDNWAKAESQA